MTTFLMWNSSLSSSVAALLSLALLKSRYHNFKDIARRFSRIIKLQRCSVLLTVIHLSLFLAEILKSASGIKLIKSHIPPRGELTTFSCHDTSSHVLTVEALGQLLQAANSNLFSEPCVCLITDDACVFCLRVVSLCINFYNNLFTHQKLVINFTTCKYSNWFSHVHTVCLDQEDDLR